MTTTVRLGISTCPNDTFAFHALLNRLVDWRGINYKIELLDIQELNERLFLGKFDVAKASFHAAILLADRTVVLPSGSALGFGVGPLLLAAQAQSLPEQNDQVTLCPGEHTTAALLFSLFYPNTTRVQHVVFSDILPRLVASQADFGVCIHEGRFTWQAQGLACVEDLGLRWERETKCPLPLGGILASSAIDVEVLRKVQSTIRESLEYAVAQPSAALPTMRHYAQEFDDRVLMQHVELYVNDWTLDLGEVGRAALHEMSLRAQRAGITPQTDSCIRVFDAC